jgi:hypothetical protein
MAFLGSGRLILLQYNAAHSDIPSLRLMHDVVPQLCSRQGKITALTIAFIVPAEIRKQLQQALLLPHAGDESQQGRIIAEHTMVHVAQHMVVWQARSGMIAR